MVVLAQPDCSDARMDAKNGFTIKNYIDLDIQKKSDSTFFDERNTFEN